MSVLCGFSSVFFAHHRQVNLIETMRNIWSCYIEQLMNVIDILWCGNSAYTIYSKSRDRGLILYWYKYLSMDINIKNNIRYWSKTLFKQICWQWFVYDHEIVSAIMKYIVTVKLRVFHNFYVCVVKNIKYVNYLYCICMRFLRLECLWPNIGENMMFKMEDYLLTEV